MLTPTDSPLPILVRELLHIVAFIKGLQEFVQKIVSQAKRLRPFPQSAHSNCHSHLIFAVSGTR